MLQPTTSAASGGDMSERLALSSSSAEAVRHLSLSIDSRIVPSRFPNPQVKVHRATSLRR